MSSAARLDRIVPRLSARQRAVLVLHALTAGQEPDPQLRRIDDDSERRAFNRYMGLFYVANVELEAALLMISYHAQRLEAATTLALLREAAAIVQADTGEQPDPRVVKRWRRSKTVNLPEFLLGLAEEERERLLDDVRARWHELLALELVWDELAAEFDGESILLPEVEALGATTREQLQLLAVRLGDAKLRVDPSDEFLAALRARVDRAFSYLRLVEV